VPAYLYGRRTRVGLLVMLAVAVLSAAGVLFLKYQLEQFRASVESQAEARMGARLSMGTVKVFGLHGLRMDEFRVEIDQPNGPELSVEAPVALLYIDMTDLLYGTFTIKRLQLDEANIVVRRRPGKKWFDPSSLELPSEALPGPVSPSFRIVGTEGTLAINNLLGEADLEIEPLEFDLTRLPESPDISVRITGFLYGLPEKRVEAKLDFHSLEDFELRAQIAELSAEDIRRFAPASREFLRSGTASPYLRASGHPEETIVVSLDMPFDGLDFDVQPSALLPNSGTLTALAHYNRAEELLTLTTAKAKSDRFTGQLEGSISFQTETPQMDLQLHVNEFPAEDILDAVLGGRTDDVGELGIQLQRPYAVQFRIAGHPDTLQLRATADVASGNLDFQPANPLWPTANLPFSQVQLAWDEGNALPTGRLHIAGGTFSHPLSGVTASNVGGTLSLEDDRLTLNPFNFQALNGHLSGNLAYTLASQEMAFSISGTLAKIETTPWANLLPKTRLAGAIHVVQGKGALSPTEQRYEANVDATGLEVRHQWWLGKATGIGASLSDLTVHFQPGKRMKITSAAKVDTSVFDASVELAPHKGGLRLSHARIDSESLDVVSAGKCVYVPYTITGGRGSEAFYEWTAQPGEAGEHTAKLGAKFDRLVLHPKANDTPILLEQAHVETRFDNSNPDQRSGELSLSAQNASLPPFGTSWLLSLRPEDPELAAKYPLLPRDWNYALKAERISFPPWSGTNFKGIGYTRESKSGLESFSANIGEGTIQGAYHRQQPDNVQTLECQWENIPATFLIQHLKLPELLTGTASGAITYTIDLDDPSTLQGTGQFKITDGQFSADYMFNQFQEQLAGEFSSLPPSLKFSEFSATVELAGDIVRTPAFKLVGQGVSLDGKGEYVIDGDMDYRLKVTIAPQVAKLMPTLREKISVEGYIITDNNIEFAIDLTGPTFHLSSKVVEPPDVGLTIVSGVAGAGGTVVKVIDTPRKILIDVFKIFGGILGAGGK
jgi:hypothetical protein